MKKTTIFGLVLLAGFVSLLFFSFGEQVQGYMVFEEAASSGKRAHVVGTWVRERQYSYARDRNTFSFYMADQTGDVRLIEYANPKPANFEDADQIVVEGSMVGDVFQAEHILVKCPSKYNETQSLESSTTAHTS
jgi:cytochrome c-type biogenesis protein CcmE